MAHARIRDLPQSESQEFDLLAERSGLAINRDDLQSCLIDQPGAFYRVAAAYTRAAAQRDAAKLDLEDGSAKLALDIRVAAVKAEEKMTEAQLQQKLQIAPKIQELNRGFLKAKTEADDWLALKEAFHQRSFMLRELVSLYVTERSDNIQAGGRMGNGRAQVADDQFRRDKAASGEERRARSESLPERTRTR